MGKTKVIAIEGIDGSGKSVQYNKLAEALTDMGYSVEKREYPKYESYFGSHVGSYLSGSEGVKMPWTARAWPCGLRWTAGRI